MVGIGDGLNELFAKASGDGRIGENVEGRDGESPAGSLESSADDTNGLVLETILGLLVWWEFGIENFCKDRVKLGELGVCVGTAEQIPYLLLHLLWIKLVSQLFSLEGLRLRRVLLYETRQ